MIDAIRIEATRRNIRRLCHFTPSRNLIHIFGGETGILATKHLRADERLMYTPTDLKRLDGHTGHICASIEYPNAWYFDSARALETIFKDWVVLLLDAKCLWQPGTRFSRGNAAAGYGANIDDGLAAFSGLFAPSVVGTSGRTFRRSSAHMVSCPTDNQAEVLIPDIVPISDILGIVVHSKDQAQRELIRAEYSSVRMDPKLIVVSPVMYDKYALKSSISSGSRPAEIAWTEQKSV